MRRIFGIIFMLLYVAGCSDSTSPTPGQPPARGAGGGKADMRFPVETAPVVARRVEYTLSAVGSVEAYERVQVTARVAGVVERVRFREGESVRSDQVLVEIEPARYTVAVTAAAASLSIADAAQADATASLSRREKAIAQNPGLIPGEEIATFRTRVQTALAQQAQAKATLEQAEINLRDAYVRAPRVGTAPAAGVIETRTIQTGQYVQPGTVMATLVQRDPLLLRFSVSEGDVDRLSPKMRVTFRVRGATHEYAAIVTHVAQTADAESRRIAIVAQVDRASSATLHPGAFAEVTIPMGANEDAPVIPQTAIRPSERGFLAFVIEGEVAHERVLTLGMRTAGGEVEVREGLTAGERLVIRGAEALRDGVVVRVTESGPK